ncbi:TPA: hypothetical protein ACGHX2_003690, partial [Salmonella enterica subsp. enterica serovar Chester]|nr:hypothetical protein [Salmonella enterica subsp. enterica serovar Chester]
MTIEQSLHKLVNAFKEGKYNMGVIEYSDKELSSPIINPPLSGELLYYYSHLNLKDVPIFSGDLHLQLIENNDLENALDGWRSPDDQSDWRDDYIIFAERHGDVLFCDLRDINSPVYSCRHGAGKITPYKLTNSLSEFIHIYTSIIEVDRVEFNHEINDEDFNQKPEFTLSMKNILEKNLTHDLSNNFF